MTDSAAALVEIRIGGQVKSIHDYAESSPPWFQRLRHEIDRVGATHDPRHGEAGTEPLVRIQDEYLPKPGLTDLMTAASRSNVTEVRKLIAMGAPGRGGCQWLDGADVCIRGTCWLIRSGGTSSGRSERQARFAIRRHDPDGRIAERLFRSGSRSSRSQHQRPESRWRFRADAAGGSEPSR